MSDLLKKAYELLVGDDTVAMPSFSMPKGPKRPLNKLTERELIQLESEIGSTLFGEILAGHERKFFNLDEKTWIWYEEWPDRLGKQLSTTTRYEVQDMGVLKVQEGARYNFLGDGELENFYMATQLYYERVMREIYKYDPQTGLPLASQ